VSDGEILLVIYQNRTAEINEEYETTHPSAI
jgi:hypothetical protein